jgi:L-lysine exporter family protein LysE/ArgO
LTHAQGWTFLSGVMCASAIWFFGITFFLQIFGSRFTPRVISWINIVCGAVIIAYGIKLLVQFFLIIAP